MENNDKFIRDTEFGKLMETKNEVYACLKCKYNNLKFSKCVIETYLLCVLNKDYYFAKDETEEKTTDG